MRWQFSDGQHVFLQSHGFVVGTSLACSVGRSGCRLLVCHAVDTAVLATSILFGRLICVATLSDFSEKGCRKNLPLDVTEQMNREPSEFCRHALAEFSFLTENGFSETHTVRASSFSIEYRSASSLLIGIGAFLPRYEYGVSLLHNENQYSLHELVVILDAADADAPNWTWAHSDPTVFTQHISYSVSLLRKFLGEVLRDNGDLWKRISQRQTEMAARQHQTDQLKTADAAFSDGRWGDAIAIYESMPTLSPVQENRLGIAKRRFK